VFFGSIGLVATHILGRKRQVSSLNDTASEYGGEAEVQAFSIFAPRQGVDIKDAAMTSLAFAPTKLNASDGLLAIEFEDGMLELWSVPIDPSEIQNFLW
jgi:hypothetical protein